MQLMQETALPLETLTTAPFTARPFTTTLMFHHNTHLTISTFINTHSISIRAT